MHATSLVLSMCEEILRLAQQEVAKGVSSSTVRSGDLSGVEIEAFAFAFEVYKKTNPFFEGAELKIERVPARMRCLLCGHETEAKGFEPCPACGQWGLQAISGKELDLVKVEFIVEDGGKDV